VQSVLCELSRFLYRIVCASAQEERKAVMRRASLPPGNELICRPTYNVVTRRRFGSVIVIEIQCSDAGKQKNLKSFWMLKCQANFTEVLTDTDGTRYKEWVLDRRATQLRPLWSKDYIMIIPTIIMFTSFIGKLWALVEFKVYTSGVD
jgi:hypothetical protein